MPKTPAGFCAQVQQLNKMPAPGNCKCPFKAATVNDYFEKELLNFQLAPATGDLYKQIVMDVFHSGDRKRYSNALNALWWMKSMRKTLRRFDVP